MSNVPNVRFNEFAGQWQQQRLGDIGKMYGRSYAGQPTGQGGYMITRPTAYHHRILTADDLVPTALMPKADTVSKGDVIFTTSGGKGNDVAVASVVTCDVPNLYFGDFLVCFRPNMAFDPYYLAEALARPPIRAKLNDLAQTGTSLANIKKADILTISIEVAPLAVQKQIGEALQVLDQQLHALERRDGALQQQKKWMMRNLFV